MADPHGSAEDAKAADERAQKRDPHGVKPGGEAGQHEPAGRPSPDRHETETAGDRQDGQKKPAAG
ncbi:MAG: hypothetical protein JO110_00925 [Acetobacteraceae bacterium]|nr:hypothetical protein [Acetobacteraceae bacterium]